MEVIVDADGLARYAGCAFVPTMGALHEGHLTIVRKAAQTRDPLRRRPPVVVSIFVNPTQFGDPNDLARYPRVLNADVRQCKWAGADAVFAPAAEVIYPPGRIISVPALPAVATQPGLEDASRPGHFAGVCQVVKRLFDLVQPAAAFFGEKDWQQLQVIAAMTRQEKLPVQIVPVPTVRETDGLAMSSRNIFLTPDQRRAAVGLSEALAAASTQPTLADAESQMRTVLAARGLATEYAVVRDASTLLPIQPDHLGRTPMRALIAARLGSVRLIDNAPWPGAAFNDRDSNR